MTITINDIFYVVLTVLAPMALRCAWQYISAKYADSKYADAINAIFAAVEYVNQTFVDSLKESGCFDKEAQRLAFENAKSAALETMSASTISWLEKNYDDLDGWLTVQIEAAVKGSKGAVIHG